MIQIDMSKCTGCRRCETACAFFHTGRTSHRLSRIKVLNIYETGIDGPLVCCQCQERYCLGCPEKALSLGSLGQVISSPTLCLLCGTCEKGCPIGALEIFDGFVYVCDLCGGKPKCVEACTEKAIFLIDEKGKASLADIKSEAAGMNPSHKRRLYISKLGKDIRRKWRK